MLRGLLLYCYLYDYDQSAVFCGNDLAALCVGLPSELRAAFFKNHGIVNCEIRVRLTGRPSDEQKAFFLLFQEMARECDIFVPRDKIGVIHAEESGSGENPRGDGMV